MKDADTKKKLDLDHMRMLVDPSAEWAEMFDDAWRLERDIFFSPVMNGQDWQAVHDNYVKLVPLLGSREDLNYLIGQMIGEISNSHTYVGGGDDGDSTPKVQSALLGVDWALDPASGRYRIAVIYPGDNTRDDYRSPLAQPGLDVKAGDYVLAVNGVELRAPTNPDSLLQLADDETTVDLTVADQSERAPSPRGGQAGGQGAEPARGGLDRPQSRGGGQAFRRQGRLRLHVGHGAAGPAAVRAPVLRPAR